jgi:hypothetical protein
VSRRVRVRLDNRTVVEGELLEDSEYDEAIRNAAEFLDGLFLEHADEYRDVGQDKKFVADKLSEMLNRLAGGNGQYSKGLQNVICDLYEAGCPGWSGEPPERPRA